MAGDDSFLSRVRAALAHVSDVKEKRMFGSTAFMVDGKMCLSARSDRIMCRIDPVLHDAALEHKGSRTVVMKGREYRGYVFVDAEALRTKGGLDYWVGLALDYNKRAKASGGKRKR
ncbi:MAG: TfoX/Sxy family protein [Pseudomonadota bacterium]